MKKLILLAALVTSSMAFAAPKTEEYVVWSKTTRAIPFEKFGISSRRTLTNKKGGVFTLTEAQARSLKNLGFKVEKNGRWEILGAPSKVQTQRASRSEVPWGVAKIQAEAAHALPNGKGDGVTVCVVDTGIDPTHPALKGRVVGGVGIVKSVTAGQEEWYDDQSHGTHVSGTIAGQAGELLGVAPNAKLYAVKVLDSKGSGSYDGIADGIRACIGKAQVINMSLGGPTDSEIVREAIQEAAAAGLKMSCAAGNSYGPIGYPAKYPECTAISAIDAKDKLGFFSSRGKEIAFAAPGVKVMSSVPNGKYAEYDGTSMAAPHVAGVMALMLSAKKTDLQAVDIGLKPEHQGKGRIDALKTVQ